jgi:tetratricopeptide (TPR) repeat protein
MSIDSDAPACFHAGIERTARVWLSRLPPDTDPRTLPPRTLDHALHALAVCLQCGQNPDLAIDLALALHSTMMRAGQWRVWERYLRIVVAAGHSHGQLEHWLRVRHHLGTLWFRMGRMDEAILLAYESRELALSSGSLAMQYAATSILAEANLNKRDHPLALRFAEETIALAAAMGNKPLEADGWINTARALLGLDNYDEAGQRLWHAHALALAAGDTVYQAKARLFLGHSAVHRTHWQEALAHFDAAHALVSSYGDEVGRATVQTHLGSVLTELGQWDTAACWLEDAVRVLRRHGNEPAEHIALRRLSELEARRATASTLI